MKKILHLSLHKKWFDKIACGKKVEERREIKAHWDKRIAGRTYDEIYFVNGYGNHRPFMRVEWKGYRVDNVSQEYVILLGRILEVGNYP